MLAINLFPVKINTSSGQFPSANGEIYMFIGIIFLSLILVSFGLIRFFVTSRNEAIMANVSFLTIGFILAYAILG